jgi:hypothetical protein
MRIVLLNIYKTYCDGYENNQGDWKSGIFDQRGCCRAVKSILFIPPGIPLESAGIYRNQPEFQNSGGIHRNLQESTGIATILLYKV